MKKVYIIVLLLLSFTIGACSVSITSADQTRPLKIWPQNENGSNATLRIVDEETGVNYVVVRVGSHSGVAITPRLNADGTLYTD